MKKFNEVYNEYKSFFEEKLNEYIERLNCPNEKLLSAVKYSLLAGGKRIRPVLMLMTADVLGVEREDVLPFAVAIEYIHTYSLIHDDLPAMDNDDFRRGKPTNHKVYGEDFAILAGDALLNSAFEIIIRSVKDMFSLNASRILTNFAGINGMIGGQAQDVYFESNPIESDDIEIKYNALVNMHAYKTGKLLTASTVIPSCFFMDKFFSNLKEYGENLGLLFQVTDDLLDVLSNTQTLGKTINKDVSSNKLTFVTLFGVEKAKEYKDIYKNNAINAIKDVRDSQILIDLVNFVADREN